MRIAEVKTYPVSVPRPEPVWTAHEELTAWSVILVEHPESRDGHLHFGERPGFGLEPDWKFIERYRVE